MRNFINIENNIINEIENIDDRNEILLLKVKTSK